MSNSIYNPFSGNGYVFGEGNIFDRYFAFDGKICIGIDTSNRKVLVDSIDVVFYACRRIRLNQYPYNMGKKFPKCTSTNFKTPTSGEEIQKVNSCDECKLKDWRKEGNRKIKPECEELIETIVYDFTNKVIALIPFKSTNLKVWKQIEKQCIRGLFSLQNPLIEANPILNYIFTISSNIVTTGNMEHSIFVSQIKQEIQDKQYHLQKSKSLLSFFFNEPTDKILTDSNNTRNINDHSYQKNQTPLQEEKNIPKENSNEIQKPASTVKTREDKEISKDKNNMTKEETEVKDINKSRSWGEPPF